MYVYILYTHAHTHACNDNVKRGHEFEKEQVGTDGKVWRKGRKINYVIIV